MPASHPSAAAGARPAWFSPQQRDNWCWAACCSMALAIKGAFKAQCAIAQSYFRTGTCSRPGDCDAPCRLQDVVEVFVQNGLTAAQDAGGDLSSGALVAALAGGPVALGLSGNRGMHMVLVYGCQAGAGASGPSGSGGTAGDAALIDTGQVLFQVADPSARSVSLSSFPALQKSSSWTWTRSWTHLR